MSNLTAMSYCKDLFRRLRVSMRWVGAQYVLTMVLILLGLAWTRLPDRRVWQVALTLLVPLLLAISILELEAGTIRALANDDGKRVKLVFGAMTLLGVGGAVLGVLGGAGLVRRPDSRVGGLSELTGFSGFESNGLYLRAHSTLAYFCRMAAALDYHSGQDHSVCDGIGSVGLASAISQNYSAAAELAVVVGSGAGSADLRGAAGALLCRFAARYCRASDLGGCV